MCLSIMLILLMKKEVLQLKLDRKVSHEYRKEDNLCDWS